MTSPTPQSPEAGLADTFVSLSEQTAALVRREIDSAKTELQRKLAGFAVGAALLGGAAAAGAFTAASLHGWLLRLLEKKLPPASASFLVALLYGGAAAGLAVAGAEQLRRSEPPYPTETLQRTAASVREVRNSTERDG